MYGEDFPKLNYYATNWMMLMSKVIESEDIGNKWLNYYLDHICNDRKTLNDLGTLLYKNEKEYVPTKYFADIFPIKSKLSLFGQTFEDEIRQFIEQKLDKHFQKFHQNFIAEFSNVTETIHTIPTTDTIQDDDIVQSDRVKGYFLRLIDKKYKNLLKIKKMNGEKITIYLKLGKDGFMNQNFMKN